MAFLSFLLWDLVNVHPTLTLTHPSPRKLLDVAKTATDVA